MPLNKETETEIGIHDAYILGYDKFLMPLITAILAGVITSLLFYYENTVLV